MQEWDDLRRATDRVSILGTFRPHQRIWWIYMREAVEKLLVSTELVELRAAHQLVKELPEHMPDEPDRWNGFKHGVDHVLEQHERPAGLAANP